MYVGILTEQSKRVRDADAFSYACERVESGTAEEQEEFMSIAADSADFAEFAERLVEWFYSGNWIYQNEREDD